MTDEVTVLRAQAEAAEAKAKLLEAERASAVEAQPATPAAAEVPPQVAELAAQLPEGVLSESNVMGSSNIDIASSGKESDSNTTRIGTYQTRAFMAGIYREHLTGCIVQITGDGQLGCNEAVGATAQTGPTGATGPTGPEGKEGKVSRKSMKICVQEKVGGNIKLPPCKKHYKEKEVAEL